MSYYNQRDYANVPYPCYSHPDATVRSGGCGVCCASMVVEQLCGVVFPPALSAPYAIRVGARAQTGTDFLALGRRLAVDYGLRFQTAVSLDALQACLSRGGVAVANVGGDHGDYRGLFSTAGHYVVVRAAEKQKAGAPDRAVVWDPDYYAGKFGYSWRRGKVTLRLPDILTDFALLHQDTATRAPRYYLFEKENTMNEWSRSAVEKAVQKGVLIGGADGALCLNDPVTREQLCVVLERLGLL